MEPLALRVDLMLWFQENQGQISYKDTLNGNKSCCQVSTGALACFSQPVLLLAIEQQCDQHRDVCSSISNTITSIQERWSCQLLHHYSINETVHAHTVQHSTMRHSTIASLT
jgi:hypothetical protein